MCGITGYFNFDNGFNPAYFARANNIIRHRGPDDFGYISINSGYDVQVWSDEKLNDFSAGYVIGAFGFRRLSIIDLSKSGHQPMTNSNKNLWIVFNGEIYNYIELKIVLVSKGYKFISNSDTEVILNAYTEWGIECLHKFNGMWAFCIFDKLNHKLFCARDRFGVKPFYYSLRNNSFAFCSEIKQLLELFPDTFTQINTRIAFDFLATGSYGNETNETYFNGILKLSAGHYLEIDLTKKLKGEISETLWWDLPNSNESKLFYDNEVFDTVASLLEDSIKLRLRSDVASGTALSGGLDSSGIVSLVSRLLNGNASQNKVFTISSDDKSNDDNYYARIIIDKVPVTSYTRNFEDHADLAYLEKLIWHQEEPVQTASIFGSWQLYRFIREKGVTVALDGQGADELMGGYYQYPFRKYLLDTIKSDKISYYFEQAKKIAEVHAKPLSNVFYNTLLSMLLEKGKEFPAYYYSRKLNPVKPWLNEAFFQEELIKSHIINRNFNNNKFDFSSILKKESFELTKHTNLPGVLRQVDRNSMAFSVESRLPFLDYRLVEFLYALPVNYMIRDGYTKYAYRTAMKDIIPEEVRWRKTKIGFKMPEFEILEKNKPFIKESIISLKQGNFVNLKYLEKNLDSLLESKANYNNILWRIICFAIWKNKFNLE
jgi:asparagine synthase (glutamine-hydrolysing)